MVVFFRFEILFACHYSVAPTAHRVAILRRQPLQRLIVPSVLLVDNAALKLRMTSLSRASLVHLERREPTLQAIYGCLPPWNSGSTDRVLITE